MIFKKKIILGSLSIFVSGMPIVVVVSCNSIMAKGNGEQTFSFSYDSGVKKFSNVERSIEASWNNDTTDVFIIKITNKSKKEKIFKIFKKDGEEKKDQSLKDIKVFLEL